MTSCHLSSLNSPKVLLSSSEAASVKVVILGNKGVGKTSFVRRFVSENLGIAIDDVAPTASSTACLLSSFREKPPGVISTGIPQHPEVRLDIYELELPLAEELPMGPGRSPVKSGDHGDGDNININLHRLSIWDFSGKAESLRSVQKVFFTPQTLYVVVWDMAAKDVTPFECEYATTTGSAASGHHLSLTNNHSQTNMKCSKHNISDHNFSDSQSHRSSCGSTFNLGYDSDSEDSDYDFYNDCDVDMYNQEELRRTKRKLEREIDKKVQCWVDEIQAIVPGSTILPIATHIDRLRPEARSCLIGETAINSDAMIFTTEEYQQKEVKKRSWLLKARLLSNEARRVEGFKSRISTACNGNESDSFTNFLPRPNFQFGNIQKDGQIFPHAVASVCNYDEDKESNNNSIDELGLKNETCYEYEENFASARDFIFSTALSIAVMEKNRTRQERGCDGRNLTHTPHNHPIHSGENTISASLATIMLRDVRQKLWHRSKIVQTNYFTEKFETGEIDHESLNNVRHGDKNKNNNINSPVLIALNSLHRSGEVCYFGGLIPSSKRQHQDQSSEMQLLVDFVVLDPTWLIESMNFILQCAKRIVQNTVDTQTEIKQPVSPNRYKATNLPTIEKGVIRRLWKNRYITKQGLGLAEHYSQFQVNHEVDKNSDGVVNRVFEFIQCLLIRHGVFIPLSCQESGSRHFLLPGLLPRQRASGTTEINIPKTELLVSTRSILQGLTRSNNAIPENRRYADSPTELVSANLQAVCHGFVFVDTAPETLMERVIVHTIKSMRDISSTTCERIFKPIATFFWKDSFRLEFSSHIDSTGEVRTMALTSIMLESHGCGISSSFITCESMLVTYVQGCDDSESQKLWRQTCLWLRETMHNALDEIPGLEYREEGICPHCLTRKPASDTGTWNLLKLQSAIEDKETFLRCRHGHLIETKLNGLLHSQLVDIPSYNLAKNITMQNIPSSATNQTNSLCKPDSRSRTTLISSNKESPSDTSCKEGEFQDSPSAVRVTKFEKIVSTPERNLRKTGTNIENPSCGFLSNGTDIISHFSDYNGKPKLSAIISDSALKRDLDQTEKEMHKGNHRAFNSKMLILLGRFKARMDRLFIRKSHLGLDNRNMSECQILLKELNGTKLGNKLYSMSLSYNRLETLPQNLVRCLPNLRSMNLSHCLIYELPKRWNLPLLKKLDVSHNLLIEFPEESILLGVLELEELNLSGNKLTKVKVSANPNILRKLKRLDLSSNELTFSPISLNRFRTLTSLDLQCNNILYDV